MEIAAITIIAAGHILRFKIQAEGVAHFGTTAGLLAGTKCDTYQGCIKSSAVPAETFIELLRNQGKLKLAAHQVQL